MNRPRSKTFEEYEKETDDIWNDKEEDLEALTHSTELDMVPEGLGEEGEGKMGGAYKEGGRGNRRVNSKGKGKGQLAIQATPPPSLVLLPIGMSEELKTFFTDVVKPKASPRLRPKSQIERSKLKVTSLTEQAMRHLGKWATHMNCVSWCVGGAGEEEYFDPPDRETMRLQKFGKLLAGPNTDLGMTVFFMRQR